MQFLCFINTFILFFVILYFQISVVIFNCKHLWINFFLYYQITHKRNIALIGGIMWLIIIVVALFLLATILRYLRPTRRTKLNENCFLKMVCIGIPKEASMSEKEKHDILRQSISLFRFIKGFFLVLISTLTICENILCSLKCVYSIILL